MPKRTKAAAPYLLAAFSDLHAGSTLAPCPDVVPLDDGGEYRASRVQRWLRERWLAYWGTVAAMRAEYGARLIVASVGDAVEGDHHGTTQIVSGHPEAQAFVLADLTAVWTWLRPEAIHVIRGTAAHTGKSSATEEGWARGLGAVRDEVGNHSTYRRVLDLHGVRIDLAHHGRTGSRPWTAAGQVGNLAVQIFMEHAQKGFPAPQLALRAHKHVHHDSGTTCPTRVIQMPAWQVKTDYVHKVAEESIADIGAVTVLVRPDGTYTASAHLYRPAMPEPWRPE